MSIIIPISTFQSSDRRYFRMCPGHGHAPRAILFRDIMLDSSSFLPSDILVAIASNPLRQSVSAIRTPHGPLFPLPSSSSFSLFSPFLLFSTLSLSPYSFFPSSFIRLFIPFHSLSIHFSTNVFALLPPSYFVLFSHPEPGAFLISPLCAFRFVCLSRFFVPFSHLSLFPRVCLSRPPLCFSLIHLFFNNLARATMERPIYLQTQNFQLDSRRRSENTVRRMENVMQINDKSDGERPCK